MSNIVAFDVYGTLINTQGIVSRLREMIGDNAEQFSLAWRDKQLEYSFRRGLMQNYQDFSICTSQALDYTSAHLKVLLTELQKNELLNCYRSLPVFDDVVSGLDQMKSNGIRMYAFSNGREDDVDELLVAAGIRDYFLGVVSVDDTKSFKPNPAVYQHFLRVSGVSSGTAWLVSSNCFDVIGAVSAGMKSAWVQRSVDMVFDPWEIEPTVIVESLNDLCNKITKLENEDIANQ